MSRTLNVLGTGCPKCKKLEANVREAVARLGLSDEVRKVSDIDDIIGFGVMMTPALAFDREVKISGRVPSVDELVTLLKG
jgi:small redox-active disulfide protein 2